MLKYIRYAVPKFTYDDVRGYVSQTEFFVGNETEEYGYVSFTVFGDHSKEEEWREIDEFIKNINKTTNVSQTKEIIL